MNDAMIQLLSTNMIFREKIKLVNADKHASIYQPYNYDLVVVLIVKLNVVQCVPCIFF